MSDDDLEKLMSNMKLTYILDGHTPVKEPNVLTWGRWMETADRTVALTILENGTRVSTVFLGVDHAFFGDGPPILFETMVFAEGSWVDLLMERYTTWDEAKAGHEEIVERLKKEAKNETE